LDRRTILQLGFAGAAGSLFVPGGVLAAGTSAAFTSPVAGGVFYTKERPGRWAKKIGGHLPTIEREGKKIEVTTGHPMKGFQHYIVKHMVLDEKFEFVAEKMFDPMKDAPVSTHDISKLRGTVYVASMCNIHDVWLNAIQL
jgi:superoxide reductase